MPIDLYRFFEHEISGITIWSKPAEFGRKQDHVTFAKLMLTDVADDLDLIKRVITYKKREDGYDIETPAQLFQLNFLKQRTKKNMSIQWNTAQPGYKAHVWW